ncbi:hypothetical protein PR002_g1780 [Phytophthora rubi]|uniref:Uncharacterized protein n=1 Tax=Phytophthora rubi TaxID=129364 RepID=A0A6A3P0P9_9STRA|nr:hypothetical protein PR002_g1780 [Phytophthora rubi]
MYGDEQEEKDQHQENKDGQEQEEEQEEELVSVTWRDPNLHEKREALVGSAPVSVVT